MQFPKRWWCNGQHWCLPSIRSGFDSRPSQTFFTRILSTDKKEKACENATRSSGFFDNDTGEEIANMQFPKKIWHIVNDPNFHCMFWLGIHCDPNPKAEEYPQKQMRCSTSFIVSTVLRLSIVDWRFLRLTSAGQSSQVRFWTTQSRRTFCSTRRTTSLLWGSWIFTGSEKWNVTRVTAYIK